MCGKSSIKFSICKIYVKVKGWWLFAAGCCRMQGVWFLIELTLFKNGGI